MILQTKFALQNIVLPYVKVNSFTAEELTIYKSETYLLIWKHIALPIFH